MVSARKTLDGSVLHGGLRISGKLFLIPLVGILFLTLLALVAYVELSNQRATIVDMYQGRLKGYEQSSHLIGELTQVHAGIYKLMSWTSAGYDAHRTQDLARDLERRLRAVRASVDQALGSPHLDPTERRLYQASLPQLAEYDAVARGAVELASADLGMANTYMTIAEDRFAVLAASLTSLLALENRLSLESYEHATRRYDLTLLIFVGLYAVALVLSILGSVFILQRMVVSPIRSIEGAARRVAEGDLTFDVKPRGGDEIGRMIFSLGQSFHGLSRILQRIKEQSGRISTVVQSVERESQKVVAGADVETTAIASISDSVRDLDTMAVTIAESTRSLASSTGETAVTIEHLVASVKRNDGNVGELSRAVQATSRSIAELAQSVGEVASGAEQLSSFSVDTLSAVSEITRSVRVVEQNAKESAALSQRVTREAETLGRASVDRTAEGMQRIQTAVEQTGAFVEALGLKLGDIGQILSVIENVTDQTELLSLNAAILAAQAGEHGRGFAVVASEIKELAEKTSESTQEISAFVTTVKQDVVNVTGALANGLRAVEDGRRLAAEAGLALQTIVESSNRSSSMALLIEGSTAEQSLAARRASEALERARDLTSHIASATADQSRSAALVSEAADRIATASRDVGRATQEQAASTEQVSGALQNIWERSQQISRSLEEHEQGSKRILASIEQVKGVPAQSRALASSISLRLRGLDEASQLLKAQLEQFRLHGDDARQPLPGGGTSTDREPGDLQSA
ncbi:MAG TPA: methyl-accepting chemotaxis protein [Anaeromyxobacteraceae bacterium]